MIVVRMEGEPLSEIDAMPVQLESPYYDSPEAVWLRGNLHAHSTGSDGSLPPQEVVDRYAGLGYDFLMISDHDVLTDPAGLDPRGMLLIPGYEVSAAGPHILHVAARTVVPPLQDRQHVIDAIKADGGLAILCHPNWEQHFNHFPFERMLALRNYAGIEILNGTTMHAAGEARATDKWDRLLAAGRIVWGYGNDDMHDAGDPGLAWTVVRAKDRSAPAVQQALRDGSCYVSDGVVIDQINVAGPMLHVSAPTAEAVAVFGDYGARLHHQRGNEIHFDAADLTCSYIRVECYGPAGRTAWTQPFILKGSCKSRS
jgi:hypothetical protein